MEPTEKKFNSSHGVLIVAMLVLTVVIYLYKDSMLPDLNEPYREEMSTHIKTSAAVVSNESKKGRRRPARTVVTVQFRDQEGKLRTAQIDDNALQFVSQGDSIIIYYNPNNSKEARSEQGYKEIMKIK